MNILLINWEGINAMQGESQFLFSHLQKMFDCELLTLERCINSLDMKFNPQVRYKYSLIDKALMIKEYMETREELTGTLDAIISDDLCLSFANLKTPIISIADTPYFPIWNSLVSNGKTGKQELYEFGIIRRELQKQQYMKSKHIISINRFMKNYVKDACGKTAEIISPGVDMDFFFKKDNLEETLELKAKYGIPPFQDVGIAVTDFSIDTNWEMLAKIIRDNPKIFWIIGLIGGGGYKIKSPNAKIFTGINEELLRDLYWCSDFYIDTVPIRGSNLFSFQAMSCDLPIVTMPCGYFAENELTYEREYNDESGIVPTDCGIIVIKNDLNAFNLAIRDALLSKKGELYDLRPRDSIDQRCLDYDTFAAKYRATIDSVIKGEEYVDLEMQYMQQ